MTTTSKFLSACINLISLSIDVRAATCDEVGKAAAKFGKRCGWSSQSCSTAYVIGSTLTLVAQGWLVLGLVYAIGGPGLLGLVFLAEILHVRPTARRLVLRHWQEHFEGAEAAEAASPEFRHVRWTTDRGTEYVQYPAHAQ